MDKKVLNLGCGISPYGTHRVDIHKTQSTTHVFDVEDGIQFPDESFDEVYERNLFEHLRNHGFHLKECYRILKKGGKLTLITDNAACLRHYLSGTHSGRYEKKHKENSSDKHYALFTKHHLENLFTHVGFTITEIKLTDTNYWTNWIDRTMRFLHILPSLTYPLIFVEAKK